MCNGRNIGAMLILERRKQSLQMSLQAQAYLRQRSCRVPEPGSDAIDCQPGGRLNIAPIFLGMEYTGQMLE